MDPAGRGGFGFSRCGADAWHTALHFGPSHGTFFTQANPLTLENRFGPKPPKNKKLHV